MTDERLTLSVVDIKKRNTSIDISLTHQPDILFVSIKAVFGGNEEIFSASDYFDALQALRERAQKEGLTICCNGARRDVYPSRMGREMALGRKAYEMRMSMPATKLLDIFETCDSNQVASVAEQQAYYLEWLKSL